MQELIATLVFSVFQLKEFLSICLSNPSCYFLIMLVVGIIVSKTGSTVSAN